MCPPVSASARLSVRRDAALFRCQGESPVRREEERRRRWDPADWSRRNTSRPRAATPGAARRRPPTTAGTTAGTRAQPGPVRFSRPNPNIDTERGQCSAWHGMATTTYCTQFVSTAPGSPSRLPQWLTGWFTRLPGSSARHCISELGGSVNVRGCLDWTRKLRSGYRADRATLALACASSAFINAHVLSRIRCRHCCRAFIDV